MEPWLQDVVTRLREPVALDRGYLERALAAAPSPPTAEARPDLRRVVRVAVPLAAAATLVVAFGLVQRVGGPRGAEPVEFRVTAPAQEVALVGDFNGWDPAANHLERQGSTWNLTLRLPPGRYRYAYLVDGRRWLPDPGLPAADDDFGTPTSVITVAH
jgi:hypothetical protein